MKNYKKIIAIVAAGLVCSAAASKAGLVPLSDDGTGISIVGDTYTPPGSAAFTTGPINYSYQNSGEPLDSGSVSSAVYNDGGGLTFTYTFNVTAGDISEVVLAGWGPAIPTVNVGILAGSTQPATSAKFQPDGDLVFFWNTSLTSSATVIVNTSLTQWEAGAVSIQDGGNDPTPVTVLAPVPEPSTVVAGALMLLPFSIGAIRSLRKDRTA